MDRMSMHRPVARASLAWVSALSVRLVGRAVVTTGLLRLAAAALPAKMQRGMLLSAALIPMRKIPLSLTRALVCPGW
jgi:hypothetical protein